MTAGRTRGWFKRNYDKLLAAVVLLGLVASLFLLAYTAQSLKRGQAEFDDALRRLKPAHPVAEALDRKRFDLLALALNDPLQVPTPVVRFMAPELRVRCVNCERPIPYDAAICKFCKVVQEPEKAPDLFKEWCEKNGLNPLDRDVADADPDRDGFTNREEYEFKTDPRDSGSHPPALAKVHVTKIVPIEFRLVFMGVSTLSSGKALFQINLRKGQRTWWKSLGDEIEGFKVVAYDETSPDGPTLTLERGGKRIPLIKGKPVPRDEYDVILFSKLDGAALAPTRVDSEFELRGASYRVKKVDMEGMRVLIHDPSRQADVWIGRENPVPPATP